MGYVSCRACKGSGNYYTGSGKRLDCRACGGTGIDQRFYETKCQRCRTSIVYKREHSAPDYCRECRNIQLEKRCGQPGCGHTIRYKVGWTNVPTYCRSCETKRKEGWTARTCPGIEARSCGNLIWSPPGKRFELCRECNERKRASEAAKWKVKRCAHCGSEIRYHLDWERVPDYCKACNQWKTRICAAPGCHNQVRYKIYWDNPPNYCPDCKKRQRPRITAGDIYRAALVPNGWHHEGNVEISDGHTTMIFRGKGTNGKTYRVSWDGQGEPHWTDEGLPKGHPDRHRTPRK